MKYVLKGLKWVFVTILSVILLVIILNFSPWALNRIPSENTWRQHGAAPLIIPHGGAKSLFPENTIYAFENTQIYDVYEVDLALTKDDILISHHDLDFRYSFDQTIDKAIIRDLTYAEIVDLFKSEYYLARTFVDIHEQKPYDIDPEDPDFDEDMFAKFIPEPLADILEKYSDKYFILEIKDTPEKYDEDDDTFETASDILIQNIRNAGLENQVLIGSFSDDVIDYIRQKAPDLYTGAARGEVTVFSIFSAFHIDFFGPTKSEVLILPNGEERITGSTANLLDMVPRFFRDSIAVKDDNGIYRANLMNRQLVKDAHRKNIAVIYWTINDEDEMQHLINIGVDGIITDRPDILKQIIDEMS